MGSPEKPPRRRVRPSARLPNDSLVWIAWEALGAIAFVVILAFEAGLIAALIALAIVGPLLFAWWRHERHP